MVIDKAFHSFVAIVAPGRETYAVEVIKMDVRVGDTLVMKKQHPCGSKEWKVLRTGMDFRLKCLGCGHEVLGARAKLEKSIREIHHAEE